MTPNNPLPNAPLDSASWSNRLPPRWPKPSFLIIFGCVLTAGFFVHGLLISNLTPDRGLRGVQGLGMFIAQAFPPSTNRFGSILAAIVETFEMGLVGTVLGALLAFPLSVLVAHNTSPHPIVSNISRGIITFLRVIPDLVWGLLFITLVGFGPGAGILALTVDVTGFCTKFFAERIEEIEPGPVIALEAIGASRLAIIMGSIFPTTLPSFVASILFSLEGSVRSAAVLGLVGAGGIGTELTASMGLLRYDEAFMMMLLIFAVVLSIEKISERIRKAII